MCFVVGMACATTWKPTISMTTSWTTISIHSFFIATIWYSISASTTWKHELGHVHGGLLTDTMLLILRAALAEALEVLVDVGDHWPTILVDLNLQIDAELLAMKPLLARHVMQEARYSITIFFIDALAQLDELDPSRIEIAKVSQHEPVLRGQLTMCMNFAATEVRYVQIRSDFGNYLLQVHGVAISIVVLSAIDQCV